jgi:ketosteroid isomerase-like protein
MMAAVLVLMAMITGCLENQDQRQISGLMKQWKVAYQQEDVDKMLASYSEDYEGANGESKEQVREFLVQIKDGGYLSGSEMDLDDAEIKITGNTATVEPIRYVGDWGEMQTTRVLKKEGNVWQIVETRQY